MQLNWQDAALTLFAVGLAPLLTGLIIAIVARKPGITASDMFRAGNSLSTRARRYVRAEWAGVVRNLTVVGLVLWATGLLIVLLQAIRRAW